MFLWVDFLLNKLNNFAIYSNSCAVHSILDLLQVPVEFNSEKQIKYAIYSY